MAQEYLKLFMLALLPAAASAAVFVLVRKTGLGKMSRSWQQVIIGMIFGMISILELDLGVEIEGYIVSIRDAASVCAGLIFGGPAGILAGAISSAERFISVGLVTGIDIRLVCSTVSALCGGLLAAAARKLIYEDRIATPLSGFVIAATATIIRLCVLMLFYSRDLEQAYSFIATYSLYVVACNGLAAALGIIAVRVINHDRPFSETGRQSHMARLRGIMLATVAFVMLVSIVLTFLMDIHTMNVNIASETMRDEVYRMSVCDAYLDLYLEFMVLALLYAFMYVMMRKLVNSNITLVNEKLRKVIGEGTIEVQGNNQMDSIVSAEKNFEMFTDYIAEKIDDEMDTARSIQMSAMPGTSRITPELAISASMEPAREVGGDFYDYFQIDDVRVAVLMADVSGKGIGAAMFMMKAKGAIRRIAEDCRDVGEIFRRANNTLAEGNAGGVFVTVWMGIINLETGHVEYADAGHGYPLLKVPGKGFEYVDSNPEIVMGVIKNVSYSVQHLEMTPGSRLYLFTDGVTEANDTGEAMYGEDRLQACLTDQCAGQKGANLINIVREELAAFAGGTEQSDDITMLAADYMGSMEAAETASRTFMASNDKLDEATAFISGMLAKAGCSPVNEMQINVAFEELFINIASYAYPDGEGDATVEVQVKPGVAQIKLADAGIPFNPLDNPEPDLTLPAAMKPIGGLGIAMVRDSMDYVHYEYENGRNIFTMKKILD